MASSGHLGQGTQHEFFLNQNQNTLVLDRGFVPGEGFHYEYLENLWGMSKLGASQAVADPCPVPPPPIL